MSKEYSYPSEANWDTGSVTLAGWFPKYSSWVRRQDSPSEFEAVIGGTIDRPTRVSVKFDTVADIYKNADYIDASARPSNHRGVRNCFAYSETGVVTDSDDATFEKLIPATVTINVTESVLTEFTETERKAFLTRALGAFLGMSVTEATGESADDYAYLDYMLRLNGDNRPHNFSGILG